MIATVSGPTLIQELQHHSALLHRMYEGETVLSVVDDLLTGTGWTHSIDVSIQNEQISVGFDGKTLWACLLEIANLFGAHIREDYTSRTLYLGHFGISSGIYCTNNLQRSQQWRLYETVGMIESIKHTEDSEGIINRIIPVGQGEGITIFTMRWTSRSVLGGYDYNVTTGTNHDGTVWWGVEDLASIAAYGLREAVIPFKDIGPLANSPVAFENAANSLYDLAVAELKRRKDPIEQYDMSVRFNRVLPIVIGETLHVDYHLASMNVDADLIVIDRQVQYSTEDQTVVKLTVAPVASWMQSDQEIIIGSIESLDLMKVAVKLYPVFQDHGTMRGPVEASGSRWFRYKVRYTNFINFVHGCWLDFELVGLQSSTKSASAKSDDTSGPSSQSSASGGSHTHPVNTGPINTSGANPGVSEPHVHGYIGLLSAIQSSGSHSHSISHDHNIPGHTHNLVYGVFRDSLPNPATTQIWINSVLFATYTNSQFQVDITSGIVDIDGQPLRQENIVEFRTTASKAYDVIAHGYSFISVSAIGKGVG